ncbi:putative matrix metalloproteinase-21, partial [Apostichopus japonicus]
DWLISTCKPNKKPRCGVPDNPYYTETKQIKAKESDSLTLKATDEVFKKSYLDKSDSKIKDDYISDINHSKDVNNKHTNPKEVEAVTQHAEKRATESPRPLTENEDNLNAFYSMDYSIEEDVLSSEDALDLMIEEANFGDDLVDFEFIDEMVEENDQSVTSISLPIDDFQTDFVTDLMTTVVDIAYDDWTTSRRPNIDAENIETSSVLTTTTTLYSSLTQQILSKLSPQGQMKKRSVSLGVIPGPEETGLNFKLTSSPIKWRLLSVYCSQHFSSCSSSRAVLELAFRRWAEVTPLTFQEQRTGDLLDVDIQIAFLTKESTLDFNIALHEDEYARYQVSPDGVYLFFQDEVQWTHQSDRGFNLFSVAVHEIGHILGLDHRDDSDSTMYPFYQTYTGRVVIDAESRALAQGFYGKCSGSFDAAFDWVRTLSNGRKVYSSYFFRDGWAWLYDNSNGRPRNGEPRSIGSLFEGVPDNVDVVLQIRPRRNANDNLNDDRNDMYFFKGSRYWRLDHNAGELYQTDPDTGVYYGPDGRLISDGWPALSGQNQRIPDNLDAAYFDQRDNHIYFFKGSQVYAYDVENNGCCGDGYPMSINQAYPGRFALHSPLPDNIDVAYYSLRDRKLYFMKGDDYWENETYNRLADTVVNKVGYSAKWNSKWNDICDVE